MITTTALKQTIIARISSGTTGSLLMQKAMIEVQNGDVDQQTITRATGANMTDKFIRQKFSWPKTTRQSNWYLKSHGKNLKGFIMPLHAQITRVTRNARQFLIRIKSTTWKPSLEIILNTEAIMTTPNVQVNCKTMALTLLSLCSSIIGY